MDPSITANYGAYAYNTRNPNENSPAFHHGGVHGHNLTTLAALSTLGEPSTTIIFVQICTIIYHIRNIFLNDLYEILENCNKSRIYEII